MHGGKLAPEIHRHPVYAPVHSLKAAGVIEEGDGQRVGEQALRRRRVGRRLDAGECRQGSEIAEPKIAGGADDSGVEVMRAIDSRKKSLQLQLANREIESGAPQACLHHLLQGSLTAAHG